MHRIEQINPIHHFPIIFLAVFFTSLFLWNMTTIADSDYWTRQKIQLSNNLRTHSYNFNPDTHSTHPGTFPLLVSNFFSRAYFSPLRSIRLACVIIDSLVTFIILLYIFRIYKNNLWWLVWIAILLGSDYAIFTNPSDIITAKLLGLTSVITLFHTKARKLVTLPNTLILGLCIGLALASRIHMTILLTVLIPVLVWYYSSFKNATFLILIAIIVFVTANPYLWHSPLTFLSSSLLGTATLIDTDITTNNLPAYYFREVNLAIFISNAPLAFAAYVSLICLIIFNRQLSIPRSFLLTLFLSINIATVLLIKSSMNNLRFFYSIIFILHIFLPLLTIDILHSELFNKLLARKRLFFYYALLIEILLLVLSLVTPHFSDLVLWFSRIIIFYIIVLLFMITSEKYQYKSAKVY